MGVRKLEATVAANPADAKAQRDLATAWLDRHRPARALTCLEAALARHDCAELLLLRGIARLQLGRAGEALADFLEVARREPRLRYGEAYLRGGDALIALRRWDDAEDTLRAYLAINGSSLEARCKLALVLEKRGEGDDARALLREARAVYRELPGFQRRKQRFWYLRALTGL